MDTIDKINQKLIERKMSGAMLTRAIGLTSTGTWSQWKNRKTSPSRKNLIAIAKVFNCSVAELMPDNETPATDGDGLTDIQREFIQIVSDLSEQEVSVLLSTAKALIASRKFPGDS